MPSSPEDATDMAEVNLALLGGFRLQTDSGGPVPLSTKKAGALLAYLALHPGQAQARPKLAALLWGDRSDAQARDSLRQALSLVRKALAHVDSRALIAHEDSISFEPTALTTDAIVFGNLAAQEEARSLEQAITLYGGEFLDGFEITAPEFESWVTAERERFRETALEAMTRLLDHYLSKGAVERGIRIAARLLAADPLQERVHRTLMELYYRQGRHGAALRQYRTCADLVAKELGIEPDAATMALRREILHSWNQQGATTSASGSDDRVKAPRYLEVESRVRLSIVVLPFVNLSCDPEQDYFVDGVTESLTTDLSRISGSFIIGRHTAFTYKGKARDPRQIGRELNVRYVLEGSVQRSGNRLRVNVQLIDAETANHLWAERFDKPVADLFDMQDEIVTRLARSLNWRLIEAEARRAERSLHPNSMDLYFQGMACLNKGGLALENLTRAQGFFQRALALDPGHIEALVGSALVDTTIASYLLTDDRIARFAAAETAATEALSLAPDNALAHVVFSAVLMGTNRVVQGIAECERALALDHNLAEAHGVIGFGKSLLGRAAETEGHIQEALRLSPRDILAYRWMANAGVAKLHLGAITEAVVWLRRSIEANRNNPMAYFDLAGALALLGHLDEARAAAQAGLALNPGFTLRRLRDRPRSDNPTSLAGRERFLEAMCRAGVPEG